MPPVSDNTNSAESKHNRHSFRVSRKVVFIILFVILATAIMAGAMYGAYQLLYFPDYAPPQIQLPDFTQSNPSAEEQSLIQPQIVLPSNYEQVTALVSPSLSTIDQTSILRYGATTIPKDTTGAEPLDLCDAYSKLSDGTTPIVLTSQNIDFYYRNTLAQATSDIVENQLSLKLKSLLQAASSQFTYMKIVASPEMKNAIGDVKVSVNNALTALDAAKYEEATDALSRIDNEDKRQVFYNAAGKKGQLDLLKQINITHILLDLPPLITETTVESPPQACDSGHCTTAEYLASLATHESPLPNSLSEEIPYHHIVGVENTSPEYILSLNSALTSALIPPQVQNPPSSNCSISAPVYIEPRTTLYRYLSDILQYKTSALESNGFYSDHLNTAQVNIAAVQTYLIDQQANTDFDESNIQKVNDIICNLPQLDLTQTEDDHRFVPATVLSTFQYKGIWQLAAAPSIVYQSCQSETCTIPPETTLSIVNDNFGEPYAYTPVAQSPGTTRIPILMYHHIATPPAGASAFVQGLYVSPEIFEQQIAYLTAQNYKTITSTELNSLLQAGGNPSRKTVMLTFDDGTETHYTQACPILKRYGQTGVFYVCSSRTSLSQAQIREMASGGMAFGSHGATHIDLRVVNDPATLQTEITGSKAALTAMSGTTIDSIAYPGCVADAESFAVVSGSGYTIGLSCGRSIDHSSAYRLALSRVHVFNDFEGFKKILSGIN